MGMVLASIFVATGYDASTIAISCVGASLILWPSTGRSVVAGILSSAPMVFIGRRSYSIYLWHWPLIVYFRVLAGRAPTLSESVALTVVCLVLAMLSWRFIEQPGRRLAGRRSRVYASAGAGIAATLCVCVGYILSAGVLSRLPPQAQAWLAPSLERTAHFTIGGHCFLTSGDDLSDFDHANCLRSASDGRPQALIIGDSKAAQLSSALQAQFPDIVWSQLTASGCRPFFDALAGAPYCVDLYRTYEEEVLAAHFDLVVVSVNWRDRDADPLQKTIEALQRAGSRVVVLGPSLEFTDRVPNLLARAALAGSPPESIIAGSLYLAEKRYDAAIANATQAAGGKYVSILSVLCPTERCATLFSIEPDPFMFDPEHFTAAGAATVVRLLPLSPAELLTAPLQ
jgi:hypothetical protein